MTINRFRRNLTDLYNMRTFFNLPLASLRLNVISNSRSKVNCTTSLSCKWSTIWSYVCDVMVVGFSVLNTYHARVRYVWKNDQFDKMVQIEKKRGGFTTQIQELICGRLRKSWLNRKKRPHKKCAKGNFNPPMKAVMLLNWRGLSNRMMWSKKCTHSTPPRRHQLLIIFHTPSCHRW